MKTVINIENGKLFSDFLTKVTIGEQIPDVLLTLEDDQIHSNTCDASNTMFSMCSAFIGDNDLSEPLEVGIPEVPTLIKYLNSSDKSVRLTITDTQLSFIIAGKKGALKFRAIQPEDVSTALSESVDTDSLELDDRMTFTLTGDKLVEMSEYLSLTGCSCAIFSVQNGKLYAMSPEVDIVQFKQFICKTKKKVQTSAYFAGPLSAIFKILKGAPITFYLATEQMEDNTLVIEQEGNYWGVGHVEM